MAGVYAYLPLGLRVIEKIKKIVREEMNRSIAMNLLWLACSAKISGKKLVVGATSGRHMV